MNCRHTRAIATDRIQIGSEMVDVYQCPDCNKDLYDRTGNGVAQPAEADDDHGMISKYGVGR